jgi:signal transduction histidine kinase
MIRLGFASRLFIIFVTSLVALQVLAVAAFFLQRSRDTATDLRMPLPDQAAALVELLESMPKTQWPLVLRATSSTDLRVRIFERRPEGREAAWYEAPVIELILRRYLAALGGREVRVRVEPSSELLAGPMQALAWASPGAVEIEIGLRSGETLVVAAGGLLHLSMLGFPPGFWAGVLGFVVAVVTVLMVRREARPLRELAQAVDRMSLPGTANPIPHAARGAPEIRALVAAFNRLSERIAQLIKARMALIGGISHDLRTYATRLRLRAELIGDDRERAKAIHDLDDMKRLLDDSLLAIEAGAPVRVQELVEIAPILEREVEDRCRAGAAVSLALSPEAWSAQLIGDALALRRLFANLTDNALAYGREAAIGAEIRGDDLVVSMDDKGPGISPAEREMVFEPFVRLEQSRSRSTGGAGLGLAIARNVAEAHGGRVTLETAPGGGNRAIVTLPLFQAAGIGPSGSDTMRVIPEAEPQARLSGTSASESSVTRSRLGALLAQALASLRPG